VSAESDIALPLGGAKTSSLYSASRRSTRFNSRRIKPPRAVCLQTQSIRSRCVRNDQTCAIYISTQTSYNTTRQPWKRCDESTGQARSTCSGRAQIGASLTGPPALELRIFFLILAVPAVAPWMDGPYAVLSPVIVLVRRLSRLKTQDSRQEPRLGRGNPSPRSATQRIGR
jgi:hypothetical protein